MQRWRTDVQRGVTLAQRQFRTSFSVAFVRLVDGDDLGRVFGNNSDNISNHAGEWHHVVSLCCHDDCIFLAQTTVEQASSRAELLVDRQALGKSLLARRRKDTLRRGVCRGIVRSGNGQGLHCVSVQGLYPCRGASEVAETTMGISTRHFSAVVSQKTTLHRGYVLSVASVATRAAKFQ